MTATDGGESGHDLVTVEIVILAMIAAFLGLRLYSVLGRRAEHEEEPIQGRFDSSQGAARTPVSPAPRQIDDRSVQSSARPTMQDFPTTPAVERGLREIAAADRRFDPFTFMAGSREAYRMVLEAFWKGDKDELRDLCDADVARSFADAIDAREAAGEKLDNRLVRIEEATMVAAGLDGSTARISVRFRSDIAAVTRDAQDVVIAGSLDDAVEVVDVWTFTRDVRSSDPDWLLDETDEA